MPPPPAKSDAATAAPAAAAPAAAQKPEKAPLAPEAGANAGGAAAAKPAGGLKAWLPGIAAIVVAPALTWATAEFVLLPRLQKKLQVPAAALSASASGEGAKEGGEGKKGGKPKEPSTYEFSNVVVNLAGTMGTRYLKTSFYVVGDANGTVDVKKVFEEHRKQLYDTTLNILSSLTLADLEEPGAKNVVREKLVSAYNQALSKRIAEQVYFYDFVVQ